MSSENGHHVWTGGRTSNEDERISAAESYGSSQNGRRQRWRIWQLNVHQRRHRRCNCFFFLFFLFRFLFPSLVLNSLTSKQGLVSWAARPRRPLTHSQRVRWAKQWRRMVENLATNLSSVRSRAVTGRYPSFVSFLWFQHFSFLYCCLTVRPNPLIRLRSGYLHLP